MKKSADKSTGSHFSIRKVTVYWWKSRHPRKHVLIWRRPDVTSSPDCLLVVVSRSIIGRCVPVRFANLCCISSCNWRLIFIVCMVTLVVSFSSFVECVCISRLASMYAGRRWNGWSVPDVDVRYSAAAASSQSMGTCILAGHCWHQCVVIFFLFVTQSRYTLHSGCLGVVIIHPWLAIAWPCIYTLFVWVKSIASFLSFIHFVMLTILHIIKQCPSSPHAWHKQHCTCFLGSRLWACFASNLLMVGTSLSPGALWRLRLGPGVYWAMLCMVRVTVVACPTGHFGWLLLQSLLSFLYLALPWVCWIILVIISSSIYGLPNSALESACFHKVGPHLGRKS